MKSSEICEHCKKEVVPWLGQIGDDLSCVVVFNSFKFYHTICVERVEFSQLLERVVKK